MDPEVWRITYKIIQDWTINTSNVISLEEKKGEENMQELDCMKNHTAIRTGAEFSRNEIQRGALNVSRMFNSIHRGET